MKRTIQDKEFTITNCEKKYTFLEAQLDAKIKQAISDKEAELQSKLKLIKEKDSKIFKLESQIESLEKKLQELKSVSEQLDKVNASYTVLQTTNSINENSLKEVKQEKY